MSSSIRRSSPSLPSLPAKTDSALSDRVSGEVCEFSGELMALEARIAGSDLHAVEDEVTTVPVANMSSRPVIVTESVGITNPLGVVAWPPPSPGLSLPQHVLQTLPAIVVEAGPHASKRFLEFFFVTIHNTNTRAAYARAAGRFLSWCDQRGLRLEQIEPMVVASYIQSQRAAPQTVKQQLAAIRMMFDHLVTAQVLPFNPAASVKGPKYVIKKGKTPVLTAKEARQLLDSIDCSTLIGLRDRALIALMTYSFARVSAAIGTDVGDYYGSGRRTWIRLHEKGGKYHEVPLHHNADEYLHLYIEASGIGDDRKGPLFRTTRARGKVLTGTRMQRTEVYLMIKRRAQAAGLPPEISCHTFRATGITAYLENGGTIEKAQQIAAHESPRTTKLYDRTNDTITLDEVERILI